MVYKTIGYKRNKSIPKGETEKKRIAKLIKFIRKPSNEYVFQFSLIRKNRSNLPVNILFDDYDFGINLCGKRIIFFQTNKNYETDYDRMLPMSIGNKPKIIKNGKIDLERSEIDQIKHFVIECQKELSQIAIGKIDYLSFIDILTEKEFYLKRRRKT
jgi:hypothetical protein